MVWQKTTPNKAQNTFMSKENLINMIKAKYASEFSQFDGNWAKAYTHAHTPAYKKRK